MQHNSCMLFLLHTGQNGRKQQALQATVTQRGLEKERGPITLAAGQVSKTKLGVESDVIYYRHNRQPRCIIEQRQFQDCFQKKMGGGEGEG